MNDISFWKRKCEAAESEVKTLQDQLKQQKRTTLMVRALDCDAEKAAAMVEKLGGLDDDAFRAHADYMADKLASYRKATEVGHTQPHAKPAGDPDPEPVAIKRPPRATDLPAPAAEGPRKVATLIPDVERVRADVAAYMADQLGLELPTDEGELED
jgi:hypothetical protein